MTFIHPYFLGLIVFVLIWYVLTRHNPLKIPKALNRTVIFYPLVQCIPKALSKETLNSNRLLVTILSILIFISLAQPALRIEQTTETSEKNKTDLILLVNTSVSMVLKDYLDNDVPISRMQKTKRVLHDLVSQFDGERFGLVILGRPAAIWLPLTSDKRVVLDAINRLETTLGGRNNDVSSSINLINEFFNSKNQNNKVVLLVNDGYSQIGSGSPIDSIKKISENNFTVHTLAIGSPSKPKFSLGVGHLIYEPVDLQLMQSLADSGNGQMVHAWENEPVTELIKILSHDKKSVSEEKKYITKNISIYPLSFALLVFIFLLFPVIKKRHV